MKNLWTKLLSALAAIAVTSSLAFAYTVVLDGIGLGSTTAPVLSCGTSPSVIGNDMAGTVTVGTATPTACNITFNTVKSAAPACIAGSAPQVAAFTWVVTATGIAITQTGTSSNKITYICMGQ